MLYISAGDILLYEVRHLIVSIPPTIPQLLAWERVRSHHTEWKRKRKRIFSCRLFFFKNFCRTQVLFVGPLIPLFWTSGEVFPGFQNQGGFLACTLSCLHTIPQIHLWCDTCWLYTHSRQPRYLLSHRDQLCRLFFDLFRVRLVWTDPNWFAFTYTSLIPNRQLVPSAKGSKKLHEIFLIGK